MEVEITSFLLDGLSSTVEVVFRGNSVLEDEVAHMAVVPFL